MKDLSQIQIDSLIKHKFTIKINIRKLINLFKKKKHERIYKESQS